MTINADQVKLFESERLTDETDGGGRATGNEVEDGQINNLFNDISRLDRTVGDVALRKAFLGIDTDNRDLYLGAHAIIVDPPADPLVHVLMFDAGTEDDERADAQQRIEAYVVQGARAQFELLGNQYENQRQIVIVQREEQPLPAAGDVFVLRNDQDDEQFVRVTEVESDIQTFTTQVGGSFVDFQRRRAVLGISAPLNELFPGGDPTPVGTAMASGSTRAKSEVFGTEVADAARYWGVKRSVEDGEIGDVSIKASSIYANLVPSAQSEQPLSDQVLGYSKRAVRSAASADYTAALTALYISGTVARTFLPRSAVRGTVQLTLGGSTYLDDGSGVLTRSTGTFPFSTLDIDYETGTIQGTRDSGTGSGTVAGSATFRPGAPFTGRAETYAYPVTLNNRSFSYVRSFTATKPRPGTMTISFMALGKWYEITDPGNGVLEGEGSGSISFATGTVTVTLSAQPDVGSSIIFNFLMDIADEVETHNGTISGAIPEVEIQLEPGVAPESVTVEYTADAVTKTLTDDGEGLLTGDGTGTINYGTGEVTVKPSVVHDDGTDFDVDYTAVTPTITTITATPSVSGVITGTIPGAPLLPGSISFTSAQKRTTPAGTEFLYNLRIQDDANGGFLRATGTINYSTGAYSLEILGTFQSSTSVPVTNWVYDGDVTDPSTRRKVVTGYTVVNSTHRATLTSADVTIAHQASTAVHVSESSTHSPNQLTITLIDDTDDFIIPGSLLFTYGGQTYFDRNGILYQSFNSQTSAGQAVGSVDYKSRKATLETWTGGTGPGLTIHAAATAASTTLVSGISGRTPSAPIRPESFQINITDEEGNIITDTADSDGILSVAGLDGYINYQTGVFDLRFTTDVDDLTGASDVAVIPDTGAYNAVLYSFLPLDAELIGLDPVRLPSDGRVPIYREGDVIVLSHTAETNAGTPTAGQTVTLARDHQAAIEVVDSAGLKLDPAQYTANKLAGTVTFADPLTLETEGAVALTAPLKILDRVEHMSVLNDVQINGTLSFIAPLAHEFPAEETIISSALVWGDINSRVFNFFKQKTWSSGAPNWGPDRIGDDTTANYNLVDNPIEYANNGAITEKWALVFTSSTAFNIVGQTLGIIGTGNTSIDVAPNNPNTDNPYFVMRAAGFGSGWAAGNVIRFDTEGCLAPMWVCRTVLSGQGTVDDDSFTLRLRGDAD